jgi:plasmid stabilization system protein ParE
MNYSIVWSPESKRTFESIIQYLEENWSTRGINNFIQRVSIVLSLISKRPKIFVYLPEYNAFRCAVVKQISLFYRIRENKTKLLTFWDNRMDPQKLKL